MGGGTRHFLTTPPPPRSVVPACAFGARFIRFISGVFALFNFLSCLYIVPLPKILASRLVASLGHKLSIFGMFYE